MVPRRYLLRQHRYLYDKTHYIHETRARYLKALKYWRPLLDRNDSYDNYFMVWLCGLVDSNCQFLLKKLKNNKIYFFFLFFHRSYKLLRWIRYQFNFGEVYSTKRQFFYFLYKPSQLTIFIDIFNGYLRMLRSLSQLYLWLRYYNFYRQTKYIFFISRFSLNFAVDTYLMGLFDSLGHFHIYRKFDKRYLFRLRIRFFFYIDLPLHEEKLLWMLKGFFESPYFFIKSSRTVRMVLSKIADCSILAGYMVRHRPFNRYLKLRFVNWYNAIQYLHWKPIKYPRKDRMVELLFRFRYNYYFVPELKKQPLKLPWPPIR